MQLVIVKFLSFHFVNKQSPTLLIYYSLSLSLLICFFLLILISEFFIAAKSVVLSHIFTKKWIKIKIDRWNARKELLDEINKKKVSCVFLWSTPFFVCACGSAIGDWTHWTCKSILTILRPCRKVWSHQLHTTILLIK